MFRGALLLFRKFSFDIGYVSGRFSGVLMAVRVPSGSRADGCLDVWNSNPTLIQEDVSLRADGCGGSVKAPSRVSCFTLCSSKSVRKSVVRGPS